MLCPQQEVGAGAAHCAQPILPCGDRGGKLLAVESPKGCSWVSLSTDMRAAKKGAVRRKRVRTQLEECKAGAQSTLGKRIRQQVERQSKQARTWQDDVPVRGRPAGIAPISGSTSHRTAQVLWHRAASGDTVMQHRQGPVCDSNPDTIVSKLIHSMSIAGGALVVEDVGLGVEIVEELGCQHDAGLVVLHPLCRQ